MSSSAAIRIQVLFAEQAFQVVNQRRYGLAACTPHGGAGLDFCDDLMQAVIRAEQIQRCPTLPCRSQVLPLVSLQERILTL